MSSQSKIYHSALYRSFKAINAGEHRQVVRFYERYEENILKLDFEEYFELLASYTTALFEVGAYRKYILMADALIHAAIMENITLYQEQDILQTTLFKKAASHYNLLEHDKAIHVLRELIKINPHDKANHLFLARVISSHKPAYLTYTRAGAIGCFLAAAIIIAVEVLLIRHFLPDFAPITELIRNGLFVSGLVLLGGGELKHRLSSLIQVRRFVSQSKEAKHRL